MLGRTSSSPSLRDIKTGDRVELIGETGVYLVVRIDRKRHCADLMLMGSNARMEYGIHFSAICPMSERSDEPQRSNFRHLSFESAEGDD